ncbi:unnamed protein product [Mytilus coruscus]|uniref:FHA domain-containing protein n=1 Tax=Mytilus coruscus TaxID=42192 RepID=A0A6J8CZD1_MYTCO|nr:unnamed protein product [Mytilus coruscus]
MKAFLKGNDGSAFTLAPKVTTVGREGCDINLQTQGVDLQHSVIEYSEQEDGYVLQDLNTSQGTYVNECRVQNATVRLAPGDLIKFGYNGVPFTLEIENPPPERQFSQSQLRSSTQISYPPVQQRPAWTQPLTLLSDTVGYTGVEVPPSNPLPYLQTGVSTFTIPSTVWTPVNQGPAPRPPTLRSRPLSAGATRRGTTNAFEKFQTIGGTPVASPVVQRPTSSCGWVGSARQQTTSTETLRLQEKEQRIMQLQEEVSRLRAMDMEAYKKDQQIQLLQSQLSEAQQRIYQQPLIMGSDPDFTQRIVHLENEVTAKKEEIAALREQLVLLQSTETKVLLPEEIAEKNKELNNVRNELERVKKDKGITTGLVTQMQRDMSSKDSTISKFTREIETLKKELRERDTQITTITAKLNKPKDTPRTTEDKDAREKELISLRQKFKSAENKTQEQQDLIVSLKQELEKMKLKVYEEQSVQKKLEIDVEKVKAELIDVQRAERMVRVDMEQASKKAERFHSRIVQTAFSTPGIKAPEAEISDDELVETLKKLIDERTEFYKKIKDLEADLKLAETSTSKLKKTNGKLRSQVEEVVSHLKENGFSCSSVKQEISLLQSSSTDESNVWVRDALVSILSGASSWEQHIDNALEKCGVNVRLSSDGPDKHILSLFSKWEASISEKERLVSQISTLEQQYKADLERQVSITKSDSDNRVTDAVEKARLEAEERLNRALEEIKAVEEEKRRIAVESEQTKLEELQEVIDKLRMDLMEKESGSKEQLEEALSQVSELETLKLTIVELEQRNVLLEATISESSSKYVSDSGEREKKYEQDLLSFKEQTKQHSVTICAMEERLKKLMKKNKEYQDEISSHKKTIQDMKIQMNDLRNRATANVKPDIAPKPKVIVQKPTQDIIAMEQLIVMLRKESGDLKLKLQDQDDLILGLRRDLAGAHARLSDVTGELSESQKQEIERNKDLLLQRERELMDIRQQLAKLSKIIDKQKEEMKSVECDLSKEKSISVKYKSHIEEKSRRIVELEGKLLENNEEQKKQLDLLDQEGRITSEMTALGAQCRGERHEQVITRQREALSELRSRVKVLEQANPPLPTKDQALQQVLVLKKELAEMRANQALSEDSHILNVSSLDREVNRARGLLSNVNAEADMERSAHRETMDALEASENTYLTLLRAIASCLDVDSVQGLRPIGHIPKDERQRLMDERERACEALTVKIKLIRERIDRKDELLQGYERDLARMRQATELAEKKTTQVDSLATDIKNRTEETHYLRESLNKTRDRLDQERRLNSAIKQRKTFHLENEKAHIRPPSHRCPPEDIFGKNAAKKRAEKEAAKRRKYEIKTLKQELTDKERSLFESENRLYTIENSMGMERRIEAEVES